MDDLAVVCVNVLYPLEEVNARWIALISDKVNHGVVAPHNCVGTAVGDRFWCRTTDTQRTSGPDICNIPDNTGMNPRRLASVLNATAIGSRSVRYVSGIARRGRVSRRRHACVRATPAGARAERSRRRHGSDCPVVLNTRLRPRRRPAALATPDATLSRHPFRERQIEAAPKRGTELPRSRRFRSERARAGSGCFAAGRRRSARSPRRPGTSPRT